MASGIAALVLVVAVAVLFLLICLAKRRRETRDPADRGAVALGKHPNVVRAAIFDQSYQVVPFTPVVHKVH